MHTNAFRICVLLVLPVSGGQALGHDNGDDEIPPTNFRFVRLTMTGWPRNATTPFGIVEITVFGTPVEP